MSLSGSLCGWIVGSHTMGLGGPPFRVLVWVDWSVSTGGHCQSGRHVPCGGGLEPFYVGVNLEQLSGALCRWGGDFGVLTRELVKVCVIGLVSLGLRSVALFSFSGLCEPESRSRRDCRPRTNAEITSRGENPLPHTRTPTPEHNLDATPALEPTPRSQAGEKTHPQHRLQHPRIDPKHNLARDPTPKPTPRSRVEATTHCPYPLQRPHKDPNHDLGATTVAVLTPRSQAGATTPPHTPFNTPVKTRNTISRGIPPPNQRRDHKQGRKPTPNTDSNTPVKTRNTIST